MLIYLGQALPIKEQQSNLWHFPHPAIHDPHLVCRSWIPFSGYMTSSRMHTGAQRAVDDLQWTSGPVYTAVYRYPSTGTAVQYSSSCRSMECALASHGISLLHLNVCASISLITSCFDHAQPTLLMPAYHRSRLTDAALFSFEGTELLMKGNHKKKHNYCCMAYIVA